MSERLDPEEVTQRLAAQLPAELHERLLLVGSLAAAYHFRDGLVGRAVNTKDADVIVQPAGAIETCKQVAETLLAHGWILDHAPDRPPGTAETAEEGLPDIRLRPPDSATDSYFVELQALPGPEQTRPVVRHRCTMPNGSWAVPSFRFMALLQREQGVTRSGLRYAVLAMMALANLLSHQKLGDETMSKPVAGIPKMKRAAKDLGRVLGLARLTGTDELLDSC